MLTGWGTFLGPAAQRGRLVFGPSEGRNVAFVDPSTGSAGGSASAAIRRRPDAALGRLIGRYLAAFPGSSREMIARWWGGGRMAAVTRALKLVPAPLVEVDIEGTRGLVREEDVEALARRGSPEHAARLLPGFDPFTNELPRRVESVLGAADHDAVHRIGGLGDADRRHRRPRRPERGRSRTARPARARSSSQPFGRWRGGARKELGRRGRADRGVPGSAAPPRGPLPLRDGPSGATRAAAASRHERGSPGCRARSGHPARPGAPRRPS